MPTSPPEVVLTFPTVGKGPKEWRLTADKLAEYAASFPGIDALAHCRAALQWCRDNPANRKTARGMAAFLTRWLGREQNRAPPPARAAPGVNGTHAAADPIRARIDAALARRKEQQ